MELWKKIGRTIRYRLVLHKMNERVLARLGIKIEFYYWLQEGLVAAMPPGLGDGLEDYTLTVFGPEEVRAIASLLPWRGETDLLQQLQRGNRCFGLKHQGQIAAFVWCDLNECSYRWHRVPLRDNEAYLYDQFTLDAFRGRNLAPYLRYRTHDALRRIGRDIFYSATQSFNSSALRLKEKLGGRLLWLAVGIDLFGKVQRHYILRRYADVQPPPAEGSATNETARVSV
jgi:hypothetical protein